MLRLPKPDWNDVHDWLHEHFADIRHLSVDKLQWSFPAWVLSPFTPGSRSPKFRFGDPHVPGPPYGALPGMLNMANGPRFSFR